MNPERVVFYLFIKLPFSSGFEPIAVNLRKQGENLGQVVIFGSPLFSTRNQAESESLLLARLCCSLLSCLFLGGDDLANFVVHWSSCCSLSLALFDFVF